MTVLGSKPPAKVAINEMTTVASVWTHAQFIDGTGDQGPALGLRIAAGNVPNFVDLSTGGYGTTIADGLNSTQTPTLANFATLANVLAGCATRVKPDACDSLFAAATARRQGAHRHAGGGRVHRPRAVAPTRKRSSPCWRLLSRPGSQPEAASDTFHPVSEFRPERLGAAAQVLRRRVERWRQADVRQRGQCLDRR